MMREAGRQPAMRRRTIGILGGIVALGPAAINAYLPALPVVQSTFDAKLVDAQFTLALPMLAFAVTLVVCGMLSDRWGRKPVLMAGMALFIVGSVVASTAPSILVLTMGRAVQSMGAAIGLIVTRAVVSDVYDGERATRVVTVLNLVALLGHAIAPPLAGLAIIHVGWRPILGVLAFVAVPFTFAAWRWLPESRLADSSIPGSRSSRPHFSALSDASFVLATAQVAGLYASFSVFAALAPHVMLHAYGGDAAQYGRYYVLVPAAFMTGSLLLLRLRRTGSERLVSFGYVAAVIAAASGPILTLGGVLHPLALFLPMAGICFGQAIVMPSVSAGAVAKVAAHAGTAWGTLTFAQHLTSAIAVQATSALPTGSALPIQYICVATVIPLALMYWFQPRS